MTSSTSYHDDNRHTSFDASLIGYDDFELMRLVWEGDRICQQLADDAGLADECRKRSMDYLDARTRSIRRELARTYRSTSPTRSEADRSYEALEERARNAKERICLTDYVEAQSPRVSFRKRGDRWIGHCPYHVEKTPSFVIYPDNHAWCFGCNRGGDIFTVIGLVEGLDRFYEQLKRAEDFAGIVPENRSFPTFSYRGLGRKEQSSGSDRPAPFTPIRIVNGRVSG